MNELERDALDHIARVAISARVPTRRLDFIAQRARQALIGEPYNRDYLSEPKKQTDQRVADLQSALFDLLNAIDGECIDTDVVESVRHRFPSLFGIRQ